MDDAINEEDATAGDIDLFASPVPVVKITAPNDYTARLIRTMDREMKMFCNRPSNGHPRSPRRRK